MTACARVDLAQLHAAMATAIRRARTGALGAYMNEAGAAVALTPIFWDQRGAVIEGTVDERLAINRPPEPVAEGWRVALGLPEWTEGPEPGTRATEGRTGVGRVRIVRVTDRDLLETSWQHSHARMRTACPDSRRVPGENTVPTGRTPEPVGSLSDRDRSV